MSEQRRVKFKAEYACMLAPFVSEDETRYYLHGIGVFPHHDKGVLLVATNGHIMGVVHDENGETNGDWICPLTEAMRRAIQPDMRTTFDEDEGEYQYDARDIVPHWCDFIGDVGYLTDAKCDDVEDIGKHHACVDYAPAIDGTFPTWRQVVPYKPAGTRPIPFNGHYLSEFAKAASVRNPSWKDGYLTLFTGEANGPAIVRLHNIPEFLGVIMPVKEDAPSEIPDWLPPADKPKAA